MSSTRDDAGGAAVDADGGAGAVLIGGKGDKKENASRGGAGEATGVSNNVGRGLIVRTQGRGVGRRQNAASPGENNIDTNSDTARPRGPLLRTS